MLIATRLSSDGRVGADRRFAASRNDECELRAVIAQHDAGAPGGNEIPAEFLKVSAVVVCDADVVTHWSPVRVAAADDNRDALALGRSRQVIKQGWANRVRVLQALRAKKAPG